MPQTQVRKRQVTVMHPTSSSSLPNCTLNLRLLWIFSFQLRMSFSQKSLQALLWTHLFCDPCKRWSLHDSLSYLQSDCSLLANSATLILQPAVLYNFPGIQNTLYGPIRSSDSNFSSRLCNRIAFLTVVNEDSVWIWQWTQTSVPAASNPYSCATSAEQGKEKIGKACHCQSQLCSNPCPLAKTKTRKTGRTNTKSEELRDTSLLYLHYNSYFFQLLARSAVLSHIGSITQNCYLKYSSSYALENVYTFYFYSYLIQKDKIHLCVGKMLGTHAAHCTCYEHHYQTWQEHLYMYAALTGKESMQLRAPCMQHVAAGISGRDTCGPLLHEYSGCFEWSLNATRTHASWTGKGRSSRQCAGSHHALLLADGKAEQVPR